MTMEVVRSLNKSIQGLTCILWVFVTHKESHLYKRLGGVLYDACSLTFLQARKTSIIDCTNNTAALLEYFT